jgi:hypothetical protein
MPDLITCVAFDSDNGDTETHLAREGVSNESYDGRYKRIHNFKYTDTFKCTLTLTKSNFGDFTQEEVRSTLKWLTQNDKPALLEIFYDDSSVVSWASIGGFVNCSLRKLANNRTVAIVAEWDSCMPFCLSDLYAPTKTISSATDNKIVIEIDTDDSKPVYPRITINHGYEGVPHSVVNIPTGTVLTYLSDMVENTVYFNGTTYYWKTAPSTDPIYFKESTINPNLSTTSVKLTNTHTDFLNQKKTLESVVVKNNNTSEIITLDGANRVISSNSINRIFGDDFVNWRWLELYDGRNEITIEGNCEVTIEYRTVVKCGEF